MNICAEKTQYYLKIPPCTKKLLHGQIWDACTHTQTLNSHFDNYVKLSQSGLDKNPLTTKHNTYQSISNIIRYIVDKQIFILLFDLWPLVTLNILLILWRIQKSLTYSPWLEGLSHANPSNFFAILQRMILTGQI
jgi:hypothetical protein